MIDAEVRVRKSTASPEARWRRGTIRRIDPWSVLKLSLIFSLSAMLGVLLGGVILFMAASGAGIVHKLENFVQGVGWPEFHIRAVQAFRILLLVGLVSTVAWSTINVFLAFLYNLASGVIGGIEVTISERER